MNGNGAGHQQDLLSTNEELVPVIAAFEACLDPRTNNDIRREALQYIEQLAARAEAPQYGILLARKSSQQQGIRYFGLQLLEFSIRYRFDDFSNDQVQQMIAWITELAAECTDNEPAFFRNKVAQLWAECAERAWPDAWHDMDTTLGRLWTRPDQSQQYTSMMIVMDILEALSAAVSGEDSSNLLQIEEVGAALNEIVTSRGFYEERTKGRKKQQSSVARWTEEGWLALLASFVAEQVPQSHTAEARNSLLRALTTILSFTTWVETAAVVHANILNAIIGVLDSDNPELYSTTLEIFRTIMSKAGSSAEEQYVLAFLLDHRQISRLAALFSERNVGAFDQENVVDSQKKASALLGVILDAVMIRPEAAMSATGYDAFLQLLLQVLQNDNLVVSIPILHGWTKMLASTDPRLRDQASDALGVLMQVCAQRLINFELLADDYDHPIVRGLFNDFDTMPERHAFLANYRRYCVSVIEQIARRRPVDAVEYVIGQTQATLRDGPYNVATGMIAQTYSKKSLPVQRIEAQYSTMHSVIAGLFKHKSSPRSDSKDNALSESTWERAQTLLQQFCLDSCTAVLDDPEAESGLILMLSSIVRHHTSRSETVLKVTHYILEARIAPQDGNDSYQDCVRNFEAVRVVELQKIALVHASTLLSVFDSLESSIARLSKQDYTNSKVDSGYHAFLFITNLRATGLLPQERTQRLQALLRPLLEEWSSTALSHAVSTFEGFQAYLGLDNLDQFYRENGFERIEDWAAQQLNEAGQERLKLIKDRLERTPLRLTRALLGATTEKLEAGSDLHETACQIWAPMVPVMLPPLLKLIGQAQAFSNAETWKSFSPEMQAVIRRTLQDRFWQSGISSESRDEFYARVSGSKTSYEGFASAVRGSARSIREQGYQILFLLTKFDEQFYGIQDLPEHLAVALFEDADKLSANHLNPLISLMTGLVQSCPPQHRAHFLPPLLVLMFTKLDQKIVTDWEAISGSSLHEAEDEDLSEEMRVESVLRQFTYAAISFVAFLLNTEPTAGRGLSQGRPALPNLILSDFTILEPLILFCTHALRVKDTRCSTTVCKILISILPKFTSNDDGAAKVREFICTEVFKAGITSLNEQYFADMQRELAALLAQIIILYSPKTLTPREVLMSLPDMKPSRVDSTFVALSRTSNSRQQRALVLQLLESVRGVSIHEMGKFERSTMKPEKNSGVQAQYMEVEQRPVIVTGDDTGLDGMAGLFGQG